MGSYLWFVMFGAGSWDAERRGREIQERDPNWKSFCLPNRAAALITSPDRFSCLE